MLADEQKIQFFKNRILRRFDELHPFISDMKYNLYISIVNDCKSFDDIREMAELDMQLNMIKYIQSIEDELSSTDTKLDEIEAVISNSKATSDYAIIEPNKARIIIDPITGTDLTDIENDLNDDELLTSALSVMKARDKESEIDYKDNLLEDSDDEASINSDDTGLDEYGLEDKEEKQQKEEIEQNRRDEQERLKKEYQSRLTKVKESDADDDAALDEFFDDGLGEEDTDEDNESSELDEADTEDSDDVFDNISEPVKQVDDNDELTDEELFEEEDDSDDTDEEDSDNEDSDDGLDEFLDDDNESDDSDDEEDSDSSEDSDAGLDEFLDDDNESEDSDDEEDSTSSDNSDDGLDEFLDDDDESDDSDDEDSSSTSTDPNKLFGEDDDLDEFLDDSDEESDIDSNIKTPSEMSDVDKFLLAHSTKGAIKVKREYEHTKVFMDGTKRGEQTQKMFNVVNMILQGDFNKITRTAIDTMKKQAKFVADAIGE